MSESCRTSSNPMNARQRALLEYALLCRSRGRAATHLSAVCLWRPMRVAPLYCGVELARTFLPITSTQPFLLCISRHFRPFRRVRPAHVFRSTYANARWVIPRCENERVPGLSASVRSRRLPRSVWVARQTRWCLSRARERVTGGSPCPSDNITLACA